MNLDARLLGPISRTLLLVLAAWLACTSSSYAQALPTSSCQWIDLELNENINIVYPDEDANYAIAIAPAPTIPPGGYIEIKANYPHARYLAWSAYDPRLKTIDGLADVDIDPDPGSTNPFRIGANRTASERSYTLKVVNDRAPTGKRPPNTLYAQSEEGLPATFFGIRLYVPDAGLDRFGGSGSPTLTVVTADGTRLATPVCPSVELPKLGITEALGFLATGGGGLLPSAELSGYNPPRWFLHKNIVKTYLLSIGSDATSNVPTQQLAAAFPSALGFGENPDTKYLFSIASRGHGEVLVIRGRMPTFPHTYNGEEIMQGGQLRYWSICSGLETTQYIACVSDEHIPLDANGDYNIMVSSPADRPRNAREACGFAWLPMGPRSFMYIRNILPSPDFTNSTSDIKDIGDEQRALGPYYPSGTYYATSADAEKLGCNPPQAAVSGSKGDKSGGGSIDWLALAGLMLLLFAKRQRALKKS